MTEGISLLDSHLEVADLFADHPTRKFQEGLDTSIISNKIGKGQDLSK